MATAVMAATAEAEVVEMAVPGLDQAPQMDAGNCPRLCYRHAAVLHAEGSADAGETAASPDVQLPLFFASPMPRDLRVLGHNVCETQHHGGALRDRLLFANDRDPCRAMPTSLLMT